MSRETFTGGWGTLVATAGVAIGLGNVWRFPYMMGLYGGSAFLLTYLLLVLLLGIPALACEWALGRATGGGPLTAFRAVGLPGARFWGGLLLLTVTMAASYYGVVVSWVLDFTAASLMGRHGDGRLFALLLERPGAQVLGLAITIGAAVLALSTGVRTGIERLSRAVLPFFFLLFAVLIVRVLTLPGATAALGRFLAPDFSQLTAQTVLAALGQAFFSLALGGTFMVVYGSYLERSERLLPAAAATALTDTGAAVLAALAVVPAVLALGLDLSGGPPLLFEVLPQVFHRMPAGQLFAVLFFGSVFLVALLSLMAAYEVIAEAATVRWGLGRKRALGLLGGLQLLLGLPALYSVAYVEHSDFLWGSTLQPLGGAMAVIALVWCAGRARTLAELGPRAAPWPVYLWIRWVVPAGILATLAFGWWERLAAP
jgi:NSS family neurotransmitter:Na+ symporter